MNSPQGLDLLQPVDISAYARGNLGVSHAHRFESGRAGEDVVVLGLVHGNELCGAHALKRLLDLGIRPRKGSLTFCFANVAAYATYDTKVPTRARFVDEDMNRVWDHTTLDGPRNSVELARARAIRPLVTGATRLLDIHSMQSGGESLMLSGMTRRGQHLAIGMGFPRLVIADSGHASGRRLRDHGAFADPAATEIALLAECGQHQSPAAAENAIEIAARFLLAVGSIDRDTAARIAPFRRHAPSKVIEVTERITVTRTGRDGFRFVEAYESLATIPRAGTVIAEEAGKPIRTPHDNCVLIMPSRRLVAGQTAVRLGRIVGHDARPSVE
ncbi:MULTISPECIES: succinylglutamate desuccinylase/aspartoacylase family protein [unclassified Minwuia]|jgi:predicted deacylase|uniref:succinylglutamate desuccinylase/aspartoacylase domain-containing protein n=1 Tax=unclassified Minwuia TaxID=2618799 RepID=UPI0024786DAE|nr:MULTISPECIES: succinylglutamate desuccinylase/aspartoacylase family protein [unclassified Minwuia]